MPPMYCDMDVVFLEGKVVEFIMRVFGVTTGRWKCWKMEEQHVSARFVGTLSEVRRVSCKDNKRCIVVHLSLGRGYVHLV